MRIGMTGGSATWRTEAIHMSADAMPVGKSSRVISSTTSMAKKSVGNVSKRILRISLSTISGTCTDMTRCDMKKRNWVEALAILGMGIGFVAMCFIYMVVA